MPEAEKWLQDFNLPDSNHGITTNGVRTPKIAKLQKWLQRWLQDLGGDCNQTVTRQMASGRQKMANYRLQRLQDFLHTYKEKKKRERRNVTSATKMLCVLFFSIREPPF